MIYTSSLGWSLPLTAEWKPMGGRSPGAPVVQFVVSGNRSSHLAWTTTVHSANSDVIQAFDCATMLPGAVSIEDATAVLQRIWPPAGEVRSAAVITMPDGNIALETVEQITSDSNAGSLGAYQLLLPLGDSAEGKFQRIYFYAPIAEFEIRLPEVRLMVHSFRSAGPSS